MDSWKKLHPLFAPALATLPLALAPPPLFLSVEGLVAAAWIGLPLCALFRGKGLALSLILIAGLAAWYAQPLPIPQVYWIIACASSLGISLIVYLSLTQEAATPVPATVPAVSEEPSLPTGPDPELIDLRKQVQGLVQWQYRAVEAEQALEQERYQLAQCRAALEEAEKKQQVEQQPSELIEEPKEEERTAVENAALREQNDTLQTEKEKLSQQLDNLQKQYAQLKIEHSDLSTCYHHLNSELHALQQQKEVEQKPEQSEAPQNLYDAWLEADREQRRYKGLYSQLREQFEEQTKHLDEARKERFKAEEELGQLLVKQREADLEDSLLQLNAWEKLSAALVARDEEILALEKLVEEAISSRESVFQSRPL